MTRGCRLSIGVTISAGISAAGWRAGALAPSGTIAATAVGAAILDRLSWRGGVLLGMFFASSSALSRVTRQQEIAQRGSRRDAVQVLANGGAAALAALAGGQRGLLLAAGSLGAATADTWATEIGSTSPETPRMIISRRPAIAGTSGAVTARGLAGASAGAGLIGLTAYLVSRASLDAAQTGVNVALAGLAGSLADSVLGEFVQERRWCPRCAKPTEARVHRCGEATVIVGGVAGVTNDLVNVACTAIGAVAAVALASLFDGAAGNGRCAMTLGERERSRSTVPGRAGGDGR